jgi:hypothetical protein
MRFYLVVLQVVVIICVLLFARWAHTDITRALEMKSMIERSAESLTDGSPVRAGTPPPQQ